MSIFSTFLELHLLGLKSILFYPEYHKMFLSGLFCSKKHIRKRSLCKGVSPWFLSKKRPFSYMNFLSKNSQKQKVFDILDRKECFLDLKSEVLKKSRKSTFCKGVSPWFLSKNRPFSYLFFFFLAKQARNKQFFIFWIEKKAF